MATTPEAYVHLSTDRTLHPPRFHRETLTFYYDTLRADRNGETWKIRDKGYGYPPPLKRSDDYDRYEGPHTDARTVVFDASFRDFRPTTTARWFEGLNSLESIEGLEHLNTSQVTDMSRMFSGCWSLTALDLSRFDTSKMTDMSCMFIGCESLTALDLSSFDTSQVTCMVEMFSGCGSLTALDLSSFDTSQVMYMWCMFDGCASLTALDLSNFDTSQVTGLRWMFSGCESLTTIYCNSSWSARDSDFMFSGCNSLRGAETNVGNSYDVSMANPETGYFTKKVLS